MSKDRQDAGFPPRGPEDGPARASDGQDPEPPGAEGLLLAVAARVHLRWLDAIRLDSLTVEGLRHALQVFERAHPPEIVNVYETLRRRFLQFHLSHAEIRKIAREWADRVAADARPGPEGPRG